MSGSFGPSTLEVLLEIARDAAVVVNEVYAAPFEVDYKTGDDPVTQADRRANELICRRLASAFPGVPVVAEESDPASFSDFRRSERAFFVDPLDGTREFVKKNGEFVVMIGLIDGDRPTLGVVLAPATGVAWTGARGAGAWRVGADGSRTALAVSATTPLDASRILSTRSHKSPEVERALGWLGARSVEALGSAGLKFAEVAAGAADGYVAPGRAGSLWDPCAGEAILTAAGGQVTDAFGVALDYRAPSLENSRGIVASNGAIHAEILERLAELRERDTGRS